MTSEPVQQDKLFNIRKEQWNTLNSEQYSPNVRERMEQQQSTEIMRVRQLLSEELLMKKDVSIDIDNSEFLLKT